MSDYDYPTGGIEQFVEQLVDHASRTCDCRLISWTEAVRRPTVSPRVTTLAHGDVRAAWQALEWSEAVIVVTSFNVRLAARFITEFARRRGVGVVSVVQTSSHSDPSSGATEMQDEWLIDLLKVTRKAVAVSETVKSALTPLLDRAGDEAPEVVVVENAARLHARVDRPRGRSRVAFIGRPFPQKGFDIFTRLAEDLRDTDLVFRANTVSVEAEDVAATIETSWMLSDEQLLAFLAAADVLIVPYRRADGLPLAVLEALNCGVPIIGLDSPSVSSLLRRHGQLVLPHDYERLRQAVLDWHEGRLDLRAPKSGQVVGWREQIDRYVELARSTVGPR